MLQVDIILGVQHGDEGKGKVTHHLLKSGDYTHCIRYNGGCNAGHTIYHNGKKFVTHHIPAGVFFGVKSIIGSGCIVDIDKFFGEIQMLRDGGIDVDGKIFIAKNAHVIQRRHTEADAEELRLGTTRTGNGPCYSDKYARVGSRAESFASLVPYLVDIYEEFYVANQNAVVLCEGAQGFGLDVDWGDYPYVTSSHCTTAGAMLNGFSPKSIRKVYGVAKVYETYVGSKKFQPTGDVFEKIQKAGKEFGATTGRRRQCNWMNLSALDRALKINGVDHLIINKMDVLEEVDEWTLEIGYPENSSMLSFCDKDQFCDYITRYFDNVDITFSSSPERI
jgi:adenylosuccinate synthase